MKFQFEADLPQESAAIDAMPEVFPEAARPTDAILKRKCETEAEGIAAGGG